MKTKSGGEREKKITHKLLILQMFRCCTSQKYLK